MNQLKRTILLFCIILLVHETANSLEIVAHRGVHQTYHRKNLKNETCTAERIDPPRHRFLENTVASIEKAFEYGATMVELDIHPTTEANGNPSEMVVFHDWTLNCRTNASCDNGCKCNNKRECITHDQTLKYIKSLDAGYGYTHDGGKTYPFRSSHYVGVIPTLEEVLDILINHPDKKLLINQKDRMKQTVQTFIRIAKKYPESIRRRIYFPFYNNPEFQRELQSLGIQESIYQGGGPSKNCFKRYLLTGIVGHFPEACRNQKLFIPIRQTLGFFHSTLENVVFVDLLWRWPEGFIELAHQHGTKIYPSQVDSKEEFEALKEFKIDGFMTNRIEEIGPLNRHQNSAD